jgi:hypothetical protein
MSAVTAMLPPSIDWLAAKASICEMVRLVAPPNAALVQEPSSR